MHCSSNTRHAAQLPSRLTRTIAATETAGISNAWLASTWLSTGDTRVGADGRLAARGSAAVISHRSAFSVANPEPAMLASCCSRTVTLLAAPVFASRTTTVRPSALSCAEALTSALLVLGSIAPGRWTDVGKPCGCQVSWMSLWTCAGGCSHVLSRHPDEHQH